MLMVSYIIKDGVCLPHWVVLCYVYGFSDEVVRVEVSLPFSSKFAW